MQNNQKTFGILAVAYVLSAAYQYYRHTLHEHPGDTFGATEMVGYTVQMGWSCLALVNRKWAVKAILALCTLQLGFAFLYYFPSIFATRHGRFWDWAEAVVFIALIAWAGYRSAVRLVCARRKPAHAPTASFVG
jgi:hypothetical protein